MDKQKIKAAADMLLAARNHKITLPHLPEQYVPSDAAEAYAVRDTVLQVLRADASAVHLRRALDQSSVRPERYFNGLEVTTDRGLQSGGRHLAAGDLDGQFVTTASCTGLLYADNGNSLRRYWRISGRWVFHLRRRKGITAAE